MRTALRLCIKDFYHRWPYVVFLWLAVVSHAVVDVLLPQHAQLYFLHNDGLFSLLTALLCFLITALIVQADPIIGDRQCWITRPISRRDLLTGKILFLICMINVPILITQSAALHMTGFSPLHRLPVLAEEQLSLIVLIGIAAVFASVTRNLAQLMLLLLAAGGVIIFMQLSLDRMYATDWGSAKNIRFWINNVPLVLIASFLLWLQYFRRAARCVIAIIFILIIAGSSLNERAIANLWHVAARYRARQDGTLRSQSPVKVTFFSGSPARYYKGDWRDAGKEVAGFILPVRVTGIPEGYGLINEWINLTVIAPDGSTWESGWTEYGGLYRHPSSYRDNLVPADGDYNIASSIDWEFYQRIQNKAVQVRASLAFRRVGPPAPVLLQQDRLSLILNGDGLCGSSLDQNNKQPVCIFSKFPSAVLFFKGGIVPMDNSDVDSTIWRYRTATIFAETIYSSPLPQSSEDKLSVRQEEGWFETTLDIPQINLSDYFIQR